MNYPDARKHQLISFVKSAIRIAGYVTLALNLTVGITILVVSELIGILEELV